MSFDPKRARPEDLSVIKEKKEESHRFTKDEILQFRKKIADKGFFKELQLEVQEATT